jgi:hypothetical protein
VRTGGVVSAGGVVDVEFVLVELLCASASGTINGIDGGTKSMLTRKIPKNTVKFDFLVTCYRACLAIKRDRFFQ